MPFFGTFDAVPPLFEQQKGCLAFVLALKAIRREVLSKTHFAMHPKITFWMRAFFLHWKVVCVEQLWCKFWSTGAMSHAKATWINVDFQKCCWTSDISQLDHERNGITWDNAACVIQNFGKAL